MNPVDNERLAELFDRLITLSGPARAAAMKSLLSESPQLAAELDSLLIAHESADGFLDPIDALQATELLDRDDEQTRPQFAGAFRLVREIGRGGLGVVYLGARAGGDFEQQVAVKLIKRGMDSEMILSRFHTERRILASLDHPNIARLIDGGLLADGRPYFAMEFILGEPITTWCDQHRLDIAARLKLFEGVCRAVQFAHARLVVHRDLKPANILVTEEGSPKLLDFGIAKLMGEAHQDDLGQTLAGLRPMTPEYAAPEQVRGEPVSVATDVYALGLILYELLAGRRPYQAQSGSAEALGRAICETNPAMPSVAVTGPDAEQVANARRCRPGMLRRRLNGDLDRIVLKAMAKDPQRRYASVEALAADLHRYLNRLPVEARRETWTYRASRFLLRNQLAVGATAAIILTLAIGLGAAVWQAQLAREQATRAEMEAARAEEQSRRAELTRNFVVSAFRNLNPTLSEQGIQVSLIDFVRDTARQLESEMVDAPEARAELRVALADTLQQLGRVHEAAALLERTVADLDDVNGDDVGIRVKALVVLANIAETNGELDRAAELAERALMGAEQTNDDLTEHHFSARAVLSRVAYETGRYHDSLAYRLANAETRRQMSGVDHHPVELLGICASRQFLAQYIAAEAECRHALALLAADPDAPPVPFALIGNVLGTILVAQGRWTEAHEVLNDAARIIEHHLGADHALMGSILRNLARLRMVSGELDQVLPLLDQADRILALGEAEVYRTRSMGFRGTILALTGKLDEAEPLLIEALAQADGNNTRNTLNIHRSARALAEVWLQQGRLDEAADLLADLLMRFERASLGAHDEYGFTLLAQAEVLTASGRLDAAESSRLAGQSVLYQVLGPTHPLVVKASGTP